MADDLGFACDCGAVCGTLRKAGPRTGDRYVCHCHDCRDFVRLCGREATLLDEAGGVSLYQTRIALFAIDTGRERLGAIRMTDGGMLRWVAGCCDTPLFNTLDSARVPFVTIFDHACDGARRETMLGPPRGHLFTGSATAPVRGVRRPSRFTVMRRFFPRMVRDLVSGAYRASPLFDRATRRPIAQPRELSTEEAQALGRPHD